jgi:diguanylate cyclase (GGDEF)-like protein
VARHLGDATGASGASVERLWLLRALIRLEQAPHGVLFGVGAVAAMTIGLADLLTGTSLSLRFLYLIPIFVFTWVLGAAAGVALSVATALVSLVSIDWAMGDLRGLDFLNAGIRLGVFLFAVLFIQQLKTLTAAESERARVDPLTGALTRWAFVERLESQRREASLSRQPLVVMHLDLNRFRLLVDDEAVQADDLILRLVERVRELLPDRACIGRVGGDEFIVSVPGFDLDSATALADGLRARALELAGPKVRMGPNIGIVLFERIPDDTDELLAAADTLVFEARAGEDDVIAAIV